MMRFAALLGLVAAVQVWWQPLAVWIQSLTLAVLALLCWNVGGKGGKHGQ